MLIPSQQQKSVHAFRRAYLADVLNNPLLYKLHRPRTTMQYTTPRIVPVYNQFAQISPLEAEKTRELISFLAENNSPNFTSLTSDDFAIILDSGCSIAMTPDASDFITGTFNTQAHSVGGIGSGLESKGIGEIIWKL